MFLLYVYTFSICSCHVVIKVYLLTYLLTYDTRTNCLYKVPRTSFSYDKLGPSDTSLKLHRLLINGSRGKTTSSGSSSLIVRPLSHITTAV